MSLFLFKLQSYQFRQVELICYWLILFRAVHLLWFRDFLDHDSRDRLVPGVGVKTFSESWTITNRHSHSNGSRSNPLAVSSDFTVLVNVGVCSTMIYPNGVNTFDGSWFSALIAVESEIPTFTAPLATNFSKIAVELHFQDSVWAFFNEDTILQQRDHFTWTLQQSVHEQKRLDVHRNNENKPLSTHNFRRLPEASTCVVSSSFEELLQEDPDLLGSLFSLVLLRDLDHP